MIAKRELKAYTDLLVGCISYPASEIICGSFLLSKVAEFRLSVLKDAQRRV